MCKLRFGSDIKSKADVSNLTTAVILRQSTLFAKNRIIDLMNRLLEGSEYQCDPGELQEMVDDRLDLFCRNMELTCCHGKYIGSDV